MFFETEKIPAYMQRASFEGKDEKKSFRFEFYVNELTFELASEVSSAIANILFHRDESGVMRPSLEMQQANFEIGAVPLQTMQLFPIDDPAMELHGVMLTNVQVSCISARKVFPDDPNFSLIFKAEVPLNDLAVQMGHKYFREKVHLTFAVMQGQLFPDDDIEDTTTNPICEECDDRAIFRDSEHTYYCQKHVRMTSHEVHSLVTKETPAQAEKRILKERDGKAAASGEGQPSLVMEGAVAPAADKDDTSYINRKRSSKRARVN